MLSARLPKEIQVARDAYKADMTYRDLGAKLGYSDAESRIIWIELKKRGLLHSNPRGASGRGACSDSASVNDRIGTLGEKQKAWRKEKTTCHNHCPTTRLRPSKR